MAKRIKLYCYSGFAGADHIDYEELPDNWDDMDEKEREEFLSQAAEDYFNNCGVEYGAYVVDGDDDEE